MDADLFRNAFFQARLKIDRANRHIDEAQQWFAAYVDSDSHDIVDDRNLETGEQTFKLIVAPIPADIPLAIGDAFHSLSSALDYVASGLMLAKTGNTKRIHFPSDETRKGLRKSFMPPKPGKEAPPNRRIMKAFPLLALEILTAIKPYKGGHMGLWEIRKADNIDKHNLILPSMTFGTLKNFRAVDKVNNNVFSPEMTVGVGGVLHGLSYTVGGAFMEVEDKGEITYEIVFPKGLEVFAGDPVFPTLLQCSQFVAQAIDRIEAVASRYL